MMKEFVKNNNTIWYNIIPKLIKIYNNRYHSTIKMKPIEVNKNSEKYIKENIYSCNKTTKIPRFKIGDLIRINLKRRNLLTNHQVILNGLKSFSKFIQLINQTL